MSDQVSESPGWTRRRWGLVAGAIMAGQIILIFWLGDASPLMTRQARNEPRVTLAPFLGGERFELENPTVFAWPNAHGFSAFAWQQKPTVEYQTTEWAEPPRYLALNALQLGDVVRRIVQSNTPPAFEVAAKADLPLVFPALADATLSLPTQSVLHVEGELAGRRLLTDFKLPAWRHSDLLTNSVVQVLVDAGGRPQSATLLGRSGRSDADKLALDLARAARFESLRQSGPDGPKRRGPEFAWGTLIFAWHTLPLLTTNAAATGP